MAIIINLRQPSRLCASSNPRDGHADPLPRPVSRLQRSCPQTHRSRGHTNRPARYGQWGVDTDRALEILRGIPISLHCWQGDDVGGFENDAGLAGGGIQATGNYPGRARTADELQPIWSLPYG